MTNDMPDYCVEKLVTARKQHRCSECRRPIQPGEQYRRIFGIWRRDAFAYKQCKECIDVFEQAIDDAVYPEEGPALGCLAEWIMHSYKKSECTPEVLAMLSRWNTYHRTQATERTTS